MYLSILYSQNTYQSFMWKRYTQAIRQLSDASNWNNFLDHTLYTYLIILHCASNTYIDVLSICLPNYMSQYDKSIILDFRYK